MASIAPETLAPPVRDLPPRRWVSPARVGLYTAVILLVLLGAAFLYTIRGVLFLIFLSILLATAIEPVVKRLRRGPFSKGQGILIVYSAIMLALAGLIFLTVPSLVDQGSQFVRTFPTLLIDIRGWVSQNTGSPIRENALSLLDNLSSTSGAAAPDLTGIGANALTAAVGIFEALFSAVTIFVVAFYWLTERPAIKRAFVGFAPPVHRALVREVWDAVELKLGGWTRGQLLLMLVIGVAAAIGYSVIGLHFAFILAVIAAVAELIPIVGPYIGGAPAVLVGLTQGTQTALIVLIYIVVIQVIEGNVLVPRIMERTVGVSPLTVIVGILVGTTLAGIGGALLAVPIAAAIQVTIVTISTRLQSAAAAAPPERLSPILPDSTEVPAEPLAIVPPP